VNVLGIWDGHDAGAALLMDGRLVCAVNEERLTRRKLEVSFPHQSIAACLAVAALDPAAIDVVAATTSDCDKTVARFIPSTKEAYYQIRRRTREQGRFARVHRRGKYAFTEWPPNFLTRSASRWLLQRILGQTGFSTARLELYDHHDCHAACAAYASGFESCLVVTIDGVGDGRAATVSRFGNQRFEPLASTPARHSPGIFFEHVTHLLNMRELEDEGKVMALADYASPIIDSRNPMHALLRADGLGFVTSVPARRLDVPLAKILWRHSNEQFAFMAQRTLELACAAVVENGVRRTGERRVALAGGVASNIKVNRRVRMLDGVEDVFVFPHMGDGGLALGAALLASVRRHGPPVLSFEDLGFGPEYSATEIESALRKFRVAFRTCGNLPAAVARRLERGQVGLWFQGRMEYGPRALGHRSVLARPDRPRLRDRINLVLKRRVWYQPFCPSILEVDARRALVDFTGPPNRHMTMAYQVAEEYRETLGAVVSVDGSCRPQIVDERAPGPFTALLHEMKRMIGIGAVLNTSFNIHGEPLVCSPEDALRVFAETDAEFLAIGPFLATRRAEPCCD